MEHHEFRNLLLTQPEWERWPMLKAVTIDYDCGARGGVRALSVRMGENEIQIRKNGLDLKISDVWQREVTEDEAVAIVRATENVSLVVAARNGRNE